MKLSDIRLDIDAIEAGDWVGDLPFPGMDGVRFKVRGTGNADYRRLQSKLLRALAAKRLSPDEEIKASGQITTDLLRQTVLLDWDGIFQEDGTTPLAFTPELAAKLLADPEMRLFVEAVIHAGNVVATRKKDERAAAEKN